MELLQFFNIVAMASLIVIVVFIVKWYQKWSHKVNMEQFTINSTAIEFINAVYDYNGKHAQAFVY